LVLIGWTDLVGFHGDDHFFSFIQPLGRSDRAPFIPEQEREGHDKKDQSQYHAAHRLRKSPAQGFGNGFRVLARHDVSFPIEITADDRPELCICATYHEKEEQSNRRTADRSGAGCLWIRIFWVLLIYCSPAPVLYWPLGPMADAPKCPRRGGGGYGHIVKKRRY